MEHFFSLWDKMCSKAIRTEEQTMAVLAQGSSFSETIGTGVSTAGLTVLTQTRMMGGVVGVERPIAVVAIAKWGKIPYLLVAILLAFRATFLVAN